MKNPRATLLFLLLAGSSAATGFLWWREKQAPPTRTSELYSLIEEGLYMGGAVDKAPPGTRAVLNLCQFEDPYRCEVHVWQPIPDRAPAPDLDWLRKQVAFVDAQRKAGRTVYVHCRAGISRSGMVTVAYLMQEHDWTRDKALEFVRSKRPMTRPHPAFLERLLDWERTLRRTERF